MGTWGIKPLQSDSALDWLSYAQSDVAKRIHSALKKSKRQPSEARAAAHMIPRAYKCDLLNFDDAQELAERAVGDLSRMLKSDYMDGWRDDLSKAVRSEVEKEIRTLRRFLSSLDKENR
jgi:hypothetical protein